MMVRLWLSFARPISFRAFAILNLFACVASLASSRYSFAASSSSLIGRLMLYSSWLMRLLIVCLLIFHLSVVNEELGSFAQLGIVSCHESTSSVHICVRKFLVR